MDSAPQAWTWSRHVRLLLAATALGLALVLAASYAALRLGPLGGMEYHAVCSYTFGPHEDADLLFIGDSSLLNGVMPELVGKRLGLRTLSLPLFAHSGGRSYRLALERYLLRHPAPRCVVLYITPSSPAQWSRQTYERIFTLARYGTPEDLITERIAANGLARTAWTFALGWRQDDAEFWRVRRQLLSSNGWQPPSLTQPLAEDARLDSMADFASGELDVVAELRKDLAAHGVRFIFLVAPVPEGDAAFREHFRRYQGLTDSPPVTLPNRLFVDYTHLRPEGARENSQRVADILARKLQP